MRSDALEIEFLVLVPLIRNMPKISPAFCFESSADYHFLCSNQSLDWIASNSFAISSLGCHWRLDQHHHGFLGFGQWAGTAVGSRTISRTPQITEGLTYTCEQTYDPDIFWYMIVWLMCMDCMGLFFVHLQLASVSRGCRCFCAFQQNQRCVSLFQHEMLMLVSVHKSLKHIRPKLFKVKGKLHPKWRHLGTTRHCEGSNMPQMFVEKTCRLNKHTGALCVRRLRDPIVHFVRNSKSTQHGLSCPDATDFLHSS